MNSKPTKGTEAVARFFIAIGEDLLRFGCKLLNFHCNIIIDPELPHESKPRKKTK